MFEKATRMKLRFSFNGSISVEDLWDLTVEQLDGIYSDLSRSLKSLDIDSLLKIKSGLSSTIELQMEIVKHIVETKMAEADAKENRAKVKQQREKILSIIEEKQDDKLKNMSVAALKKTLEALE